MSENVIDRQLVIILVHVYFVLFLHKNIYVMGAVNVLKIRTLKLLTK